MESTDTVDTLNSLIRVCNDGERGFRRCADLAQDVTLKALLSNRADACAESARALQECVTAHGGKPRQERSIGGAMHRRWIDLRVLIGGDGDLELLRECERGGKAALDAYRGALGRDLPDDVIALVEQQYDGVKKTVDWIQSRHDALHRQR